MNIQDLIGKKDKEIESQFGFDYYLETKDEFFRGKPADHKKLVKAFLEFNQNKTLTVIQLLDGTIQKIFPMNIEDIEKNLLLLDEEKSLFCDDDESDLALCFAFLCNDYIAEIMKGIIFFSGKKEPVHEFAKTLDKHGLEYHKPHSITEYEERYEKLGRNEPCHCGSGTKYKKCCLEKDIKETGKPKKVIVKCPKYEEDEIDEDNFWDEGSFVETISPEEAKEKEKTIHKRHDEDMFYNCKKCNKQISAHNKDWHAGMCDECFNKEYHQNI